MAAFLMSTMTKTGLAMLDFAKWCFVGVVVERQESMSPAGPVAAKGHELLAPGLPRATNCETAHHLPVLVFEPLTRSFSCFLPMTRSVLVLEAPASPPHPGS